MSRMVANDALRHTATAVGYRHAPFEGFVQQRRFRLPRSRAPPHTKDANS